MKKHNMKPNNPLISISKNILLFFMLCYGIIPLSWADNSDIQIQPPKYSEPSDNDNEMTNISGQPQKEATTLMEILNQQGLTFSTIEQIEICLANTIPHGKLPIFDIDFPNAKIAYFSTIKYHPNQACINTSINKKLSTQLNDFFRTATYYKTSKSQYYNPFLFIKISTEKGILWVASDTLYTGEMYINFYGIDNQNQFFTTDKQFIVELLSPYFKNNDYFTTNLMR